MAARVVLTKVNFPPFDKRGAYEDQCQGQKLPQCNIGYIPCSALRKEDKAVWKNINWVMVSITSLTKNPSKMTPSSTLWTNLFTATATIMNKKRKQTRSPCQIPLELEKILPTNDWLKIKVMPRNKVHIPPPVLTTKSHTSPHLIQETLVDMIKVFSISTLYQIPRMPLLFLKSTHLLATKASWRFFLPMTQAPCYGE